MTDICTLNAKALPDPGEVPVLDWLDKSLIDVDPLYQRPLDPARVDAISKSFSWRSFGALVVVPQAGGKYHATDGQHRLEAAKLHPKVTHVPAVIVKAEDIQSEASIFVDINKHRKNVTPLELFFAQLAADDDDALTVFQVTQRAGIRIPKYSSAGFKPCDTVAIAAIKSLIDRRGAMRARQYLEVLSAGDFAPIGAGQIKAVEMLLTEPEFSDHIAIEDLTAMVRVVRNTADADAKRFAETHGVPGWKGLANVWFQKTKKRRQPAKVAA